MALKNVKAMSELCLSNCMEIEYGTNINFLVKEVAYQFIISSCFPDVN